MRADLELGPDGSVRPAPTGQGGAGRGQGRKPGYSPTEMDRLAADPNAEGISNATRMAYEKAVSQNRKLAADADQAELDYKIAAKEYLPRSAFREATATLLAELSQGLRSLPDTLERKHGLPPPVVQAIEADIDAAMARVADGLELFTGAEE